MRVRRLEPRHEVTPECYEDHCFSCQLDEPIRGKVVYRLCGECGHAYLTARDLRRAYRRMLWESRGANLLPNRCDPGLFWIAWRWLTVRVEDLDWCMECSHDF